uniref:Sex-regulated protein janus-A n=1 Tax=Hemiscolopendra marginata TaxID=943146 RepID=A0A646QD68_9MYRI
MSTPKLDSIPDVEIDHGRFKYILIKLYDTKDGQEVSKNIVRGYNWAAYHADIYENVDAKLRELGIESECVGGGRILHEMDKKSIQVYGYSTGYGKADHAVTTEILKKKYPDYGSITWSNDGY